MFYEQTRLNKFDSKHKRNSFELKILIILSIFNSLNVKPRRSSEFLKRNTLLKNVWKYTRSNSRTCTVNMFKSIHFCCVPALC